MISLQEAGISGDYFANGSLTIYGDKNWETQKLSSATVKLPATLPAPAPVKPSANQKSEGKTVCVTNTNSYLEIDPAQEVAKLQTTAGENVSMTIIDAKVIVLESYPSILQSTYKLDDGRSIVTSFTTGSKVGSGNYIRANGEYSPDFKSCTQSN